MREKCVNSAHNEEIKTKIVAMEVHVCLSVCVRVCVFVLLLIRSLASKRILFAYQRCVAHALLEHLY